MLVCAQRASKNLAQHLETSPGENVQYASANCRTSCLLPIWLAKLPDVVLDAMDYRPLKERPVQSPIRLTCLLAVATACSGSIADAKTHGNTSSHQASSYAPRTHSSSHHYGSPISRPLVYHTHSTKPHIWKPPKPRSVRQQSSTRAVGVTRDSHGHIKRSTRAKDEFRHAHPCPSTGRSTGACPGYVIDHVHALKHGGADAASNMQWQTKAAAKAKDKVE